MEIRIKSIPHDSQRYETCGDYFYDPEGILQIRVSELTDKRYMILIAIHELVEQFITECNGLKEEDITVFDIAFEKARNLGLKKENEEPGFSEDAPYRLAHSFATSVELGICAMTGISWNQYDYAVNSL